LSSVKRNPRFIYKDLYTKKQKQKDLTPYRARSTRDLGFRGSEKVVGELRRWRFREGHRGAHGTATWGCQPPRSLGSIRTTAGVQKPVPGGRSAMLGGRREEAGAGNEEAVLEGSGERQGTAVRGRGGGERKGDFRCS
jgi:hypothetical protein